MAERFFELYSKQVCLIVEWMAADRRSSIEAGESKLKAALDKAIVDLDRDLQRLTQLPGALTTEADPLPRSIPSTAP